MTKRILTIFMVLAVFAGLSLAQDKVAPLKVDNHDDSFYKNRTYTSSSVATEGALAASYVAVDTMSNCYGPASWAINPISYDPATGSLVVTYRGNVNTYAENSGELWWSYSTDFGASWTRSATSVQDVFFTPETKQARYPSMDILNPGTDSADEIFLAFAWPDLIQGGWDDIGFGVAEGIEEIFYSGVDEDPNYTFGSQALVFADEMYAYWMPNQDAVNTQVIYRTADWDQIDVFEPTEISAGLDDTDGLSVVGGDAIEGKMVVGTIGTYLGTEVSLGGWQPAVSYSTDHGETFTTRAVFNHNEVAETDKYYGFFDANIEDTYISYAMDLVIDKDGNAHYFLGYWKDVDTVSSDSLVDYSNATWDLVEVIHNSTSDSWSANVIAADLDGFSTVYDSVDAEENDTPGLGQCYYMIKAARNDAGDVFFVQFIHGPEGNADVWGAYKQMDGEWSELVNMTDTPGTNENAAHLAPRLREVGENTYEAYSMYFFEAGATGTTMDPVAPCVVYVGAQEFAFTGIEDNDNEFVVENFELSQNYPNPFNPSTKINYTLGADTKVVLTVYNTLGEEVSTLVNEVQTAGPKTVSFDASSLASGVYFYKIAAGDFVSTKKMILMK